MASLVYNNAKTKLMDGGIDLNTDDIRVILCMTNTTCDTEATVTTVSGFTTLDECNDAGYARVALTGEAVNNDAGNNRAEFDANDASFPSLSGNGSRAVQGALIYKHVTNDSDSIPICFVDFAADIPATATQIDIPWNAEGILQLS